VTTEMTHGGVVLVGAVGGCGTSLLAGALALAWQRGGVGAWLVEMDGRPGDLAEAWDLPGDRSLDDLAAVADELAPAHLTAAGRTHPTGLVALVGATTPCGDPWTAAAAARLMAAIHDAGGRGVVDAGSAPTPAVAGAMASGASMLMVCPPRIAAARRAHALVAAMAAAGHAGRCALVVGAESGRAEIGAAALARAVGAPVAGEVPWSGREAGELGAGRWPRARRRGLVAAVTRLAGVIR